MQPPKARRNTLLVAGVILGVLQMVPYGRLVLLPVFYLNTHLHEICHAIAAWLTGGSVARILVHADGSGETYTLGGVSPIIASAGYVGAAALGAALVLASRKEAASRGALGLLAGAQALSLVLLVRGDVVGLASGVLWLLLLIAGARRLSGDALTGFVGFLGLAQGLQSLASLSDLLQISLLPRTNSDAQNMARMTGVPALLWALIWAAFSLWLTGTAALTAYRHHRNPPSDPV